MTENFPKLNRKAWFNRKGLKSRAERGLVVSQLLPIYGRNKERTIGRWLIGAALGRTNPEETLISSFSGSAINADISSLRENVFGSESLRAQCTGSQPYVKYWWNTTAVRS